MRGAKRLAYFLRSKELAKLITNGPILFPIVTESSHAMKTVGIIGAGAAGLCAARHLSALPGYTPVVWEKAPELGGTWVYTDQTEKDRHGLPIHSSMYQSLRTNLPKEAMWFPDFTLSHERGNSFIKHSEVLNYLKQYADNFDLLPYIQFEHMVESVEPTVEGDPESGWTVTVRNLGTAQPVTSHIDALIVCNGHYSVPAMPNVEGMEAFSGLIEHSHRYRLPEPYRNKTVVVLGASASGLDISLEIAKVANKVYLSHNLAEKVPSKFPENFEQVSGVKSLKSGTKNTFILRDGSEVEADAILYCTGYEYSFPFLSASCKVSVKDNTVSPLYKHLIHCYYPTLAFIGIPYQVCPFPFFDVQVRYFLSALQGNFRVPRDPELIEQANDVLAVMEEKEERPMRYFHKFGALQWPYVDAMVEEAKIAGLAKSYELLFNHVHHVRRLDLLNYKKKAYDLVGEDGFMERQVQEVAV